MAKRKKKQIAAKPSRARPGTKLANANQRTYTIPDYRLEKTSFTVRQVRTRDRVSYEISGDFNAAVPPIRESKYLARHEHLEMYRWMVLNRKMEAVLENLYKQGKVVGGVYLGLGQEACSCASAYALNKEDWLGPSHNQGSLFVQFSYDIMMQYSSRNTFWLSIRSIFGDIQGCVVAPSQPPGALVPGCLPDVAASLHLGAQIHK